MSILWEGVKMSWNKKNQKKNSKIFVDLYNQLSHRCHLYQAGWAPLIGPYTDWSTVAIGPGVCQKEGSRSQAYTHTNAAGFPRFSTKDESRHDESEDRRNWSVTEILFFKLWFRLFTNWSSNCPILHRINILRLSFYTSFIVTPLFKTQVLIFTAVQC